MRSVWCNVYQRFLAGSRSCGWAGFWAGGAAAHVVAHVLHVEHERPARRLRRQQLLVQAAVRRVTCGAMGGRGSSGLDRGSSGRGCGARYRRRAAPPPRTAARGTASALRPSPAVAARRAPGGEAGAHARAGLAGQYGVGPRTTATCSASSASSHETMLMRVRAPCCQRARDLLRRTDAPS